MKTKCVNCQKEIDLMNIKDDFKFEKGKMYCMACMKRFCSVCDKLIEGKIYQIDDGEPACHHCYVNIRECCL